MRSIHNKIYIYVTGMMGDFSGLTDVAIYPDNAICLQKAVILASLIPGLMDAG